MKKLTMLCVALGSLALGGCGEEAKKGEPKASVTSVPKPSASASTRPAATGSEQGGW
jgi:hypothetical protein